ncbi:hypothetical protein [Achromobacter ruhlandii]|uniref:hypothetical protein n=1 Tax=Achromobacter ruhlandii TaxID=72557 RepID=UPI000AB1776E|nr:hypothetical protein [Achromobacter ruhlandii]
MATTNKLTFALAGELVSDHRRARRIWRDAIRTGKTWLIPQARNVAILLRRAATERAA